MQYLCGMKRKTIYYIVFFIALTGVFLTVLGLTSNVLEKRSKTIAEVQPFRFTNQEGRYITEKDIMGKVTLVNFFFTTCRTICPDMNQKIKTIYTLFRNEPDFLILSHTSMPATDSVPRLKRYADSIGASPANWWFLTGARDSLYMAARLSYALDDQRAPVTNPDEDFIHTQLFALVNREGQVKKKVYDSFNAEEMEELKKDIQKLLK
jgi:protein SCO1